MQVCVVADVTGTCHCLSWIHGCHDASRSKPHDVCTLISSSTTSYSDIDIDISIYDIIYILTAMNNFICKPWT